MQPWEQEILLIKTFWALEVVFTNQRREGSLMQKNRGRPFCHNVLEPDALCHPEVGDPVHCGKLSQEASMELIPASLHPSTECTLSILIQGYDCQT